MRKLLPAVAGVCLALAGLALVLTLDASESGSAGPETVALDVPTVAILPSDRPARPIDLNYLRLFRKGHTLATAATPACPRYRRVGRSWAARAAFLHRSSRGAGADEATAVRWYASVTWVSQDEAGDFTRAIGRISRSRVSVATGQRVKRGALVEAFTRDALELCGLREPHLRTLLRLERLDRRISHILSLRHSPGGPSDLNAQ